jgi:hypothetical protein
VRVRRAAGGRRWGFVGVRVCEGRQRRGRGRDPVSVRGTRSAGVRGRRSGPGQALRGSRGPGGRGVRPRPLPRAHHQGNSPGETRRRALLPNGGPLYRAGTRHRDESRTRATETGRPRPNRTSRRAGAVPGPQGSPAARRRRRRQVRPTGPQVSSTPGPVRARSRERGPYAGLAPPALPRSPGNHSARASGTFRARMPGPQPHPSVALPRSLRFHD